MKLILLTLILIVLIPFASFTLILTSPFILIYKMYELKKGKVKKEVKQPNIFEIITSGKDILKSN